MFEVLLPKALELVAAGIEPAVKLLNRNRPTVRLVRSGKNIALEIINPGPESIIISAIDHNKRLLLVLKNDTVRGLIEANWDRKTPIAVAAKGQLELPLRPGPDWEAQVDSNRVAFKLMWSDGRSSFKLERPVALRTTVGHCRTMMMAKVI